MSEPLRILITGATGCAGFHLCRLALERGAQVFGFARRSHFSNGVTGRAGDITQSQEIEDWLAMCRPDWIFHLAGLVHGTGNHSPEEMMRVNKGGTQHLLEAVRKVVPAARVFIAGSSGIYGQPQDACLPIAETAEILPRSAYARSKAAQDLMATEFFAEHGLHIVRGRTFNQTGPREPGGLVCAMLARQVATIEAGLQEPVLKVVTLRTRRDFCDVRDVVAGYWAALEHGAPGDAYNICSGRSHGIGQMVEILLSKTKLQHIKIEETHPHPAPEAILCQTGDFTRLKACSGWEPHISLEQSLGDLLEEWRFKVRNEI